MEQDKNNRLDELFKQAKNEPSKVSYEETKGLFLKTANNLSKVGIGGKLAQLFNLKISIMIATISVIAIGTVLLVNNIAEPINKEDLTTATPIEFISDSVLVLQEQEKVVYAYLTKIKAKKADFPKLLALSNQINPSAKIQIYDTLIKSVSTSNKGVTAVIDTSYRFPKLGAEEIKTTKKQKYKMLRALARWKKVSSYNNIDTREYPMIYWHEPVIKGKVSRMDATGSFYMQRTEVSNLEYRTFLFDLLLQGRKEEFLKAKPNQKMWTIEYPYAFNKPMEDNYFSHPAYNDYPVVAISREGAELYCKWLTEERNKLDVDKYGVLVNAVRLPTDSEWVQAASDRRKHLPYPWGGPYIRNSNGCFLANFKPGVNATSECVGKKVVDAYKTNNNEKNAYNADGAFHTAKVNSYNPNSSGLYCMSGNVAEMVYYKNNKDLPGTKGGSWTSIGQELQIIDGKDRFRGRTDPSVNIGFRPVITYLSSGICKPKITVTPPGTVKLITNIYIDKTEISNFMWQEYVMWQIRTYGKGSKEYLQALPDSLVWRNKLTYNEPYVKYYFNHPAYNNYPVVGVSYEQAIAYCKWRTARMKELFEIQKKKNKKDIYPTNFEYRLPTKQEWERMANIGYSEKMMKKIVGKYKGQSLANYKKADSGDIGSVGNIKTNADVTAPVKSFFPNALGCYNLIGNVAEMTSKKGIAKGGSWIHNEKEISIEHDIEYTKQNSWLGFRCVAEIKD